MSRKISIVIAMIVSGWFVAAWVFGQNATTDFVLEAPAEAVISPDAVLQDAANSQSQSSIETSLDQPMNTSDEAIEAEVEADGFVLEEDFKPIAPADSTEEETSELIVAETPDTPQFDAVSPSDSIASEEVSVDSGNVYEFSDEGSVDSGTQNTFVPPAPTNSFEISVDSDVAGDQKEINTLNASHAPRISVATFGPAEIRINEAAEYRITMTNNGEISAKNVFVTIQLPDWVTIASSATKSGDTETLDVGDGMRDVQWTVSDLTAGKQVSWELKLIPTKSKQFAFNTQWTIAPLPVVMDVQVVEPHLELAIDGPTEMEFGDTEVVR